jgi:hypothetical protein
MARSEFDCSRLVSYAIKETAVPKQHTYNDFVNDLLVALTAPITTANRRALGAIFITEGRNRYWNPLNWTLPEKYPAYNSTGVREYPSYLVGVQETAYELLHNSRWAPLVSALRSSKTGATRWAALNAVTKIYASWGSHPNFNWPIEQIDARLAEVMPS